MTNAFLFIYILRAAKPGTIFLDSSTIDPDTSKEVAAIAKEKKLTYLDVPVSGGNYKCKSKNSPQKLKKQRVYLKAVTANYANIQELEQLKPAH